MASQLYVFLCLFKDDLSPASVIYMALNDLCG
jgi:hypothetical protein